MKAIIVHEPGAPGVLQIQDWPKPKPKLGWVLIRVKAFGLNRAEMFTRQGHSPNVTFPRVLGIEAVGTVEEAPGGEFAPGQTVATMMGDMGRVFDGGYAEYTSVPVKNVFPLKTDLDWATLGAIPEMFQTVYGSLTVGLAAEAGQTLLIRGGTSSIGMTTTVLAKDMGLTVAATTRNPAKSDALRDNGADYVIIDSGKIADKVRDVFPQGADCILELVGTVTLLDSLRAAAPQGIVCMTGILGNQWTLPEFAPMSDIPSGVKLTAYSGEAQNVTPKQLQAFVDGVAAGRYRLNVDRVFNFEQIVEAHRYMEGNRAQGKLVVLGPEVEMLNSHRA